MGVKRVFHWKKKLCLCFHRKQKAVKHSGLIEIRFDWARAHENPDYRHFLKKPRKMTRQVTYILSTQTYYKKIIFDWLVYNAQSILVLMQIGMLPLKVSVFRARGTRHQY